MYPILFEWQGHVVYSYGAAMVLGAALGGVGAWWLRPSGLFDRTAFLNICLLTTIGAWIGAHGLGVMMRGGLSSLGVPLIVGPAIWIYCRLSGLSGPGVFDHLVPFALFGAAFQRTLGCFGAGCCPGRATDLPWAVRFPGSAEAVHPTQLYWGLGLVMACWMLRRWRPRPSGQIALSGIGLYGVVGLLVSPLRVGLGEPWLFGLTAYAWAHGLLAAACFGAVLGRTRGRRSLDAGARTVVSRAEA